MDVSANALRKEAVETLNAIESVFKIAGPDLDVIEKATLLSAKAQCLQTLTLLREQGRR
jgi:hypothetical protein